MKKLATLLSLCILIMTQSCNTTKSTFWVSGYKTDCSMGAGKGKCTKVTDAEKINGNETWTNFYAPIKGFTFSEGTMQKIRVSKKKLKASDVPADASSIEYQFLDVLERKEDGRAYLSGSWTLKTIKGGPINRKSKLPTLNIDLNNAMLNGSNGCNDYTGQISRVSSSQIDFKTIAQGSRACVDMEVASRYSQALDQARSFVCTRDELKLYDGNNKEILSFIKGQAPSATSRLDGQWTAARIMGAPINRKFPLPTIKFSESDKQVIGNDGCNNYRAEILNISGTDLQLGPVAGTKKMCPQMENADKFNKAMSQISSYKLEDNMLKLYNASGEEVIAFIKG